MWASIIGGFEILVFGVYFFVVVMKEIRRAVNWEWVDRVRVGFGCFLMAVLSEGVSMEVGLQACPTFWWNFSRTTYHVRPPGKLSFLLL